MTYILLNYYYKHIQSTFVISTSLILNNRLSQSENQVHVFLYGNETTGNKILLKRGEIGLMKFGCSIFFPKFCKSDVSWYGYLVVFKRVYLTSGYQESTV